MSGSSTKRTPDDRRPPGSSESTTLVSAASCGSKWIYRLQISALPPPFTILILTIVSITHQAAPAWTDRTDQQSGKHTLRTAWTRSPVTNRLLTPSSIERRIPMDEDHEGWGLCGAISLLQDILNSVTDGPHELPTCWTFTFRSKASRTRISRNDRRKQLRGDAQVGAAERFEDALLEAQLFIVRGCTGGLSRRLGCSLNRVAHDDINCLLIIFPSNLFYEREPTSGKAHFNPERQYKSADEIRMRQRIHTWSRAKAWLPHTMHGLRDKGSPTCDVREVLANYRLGVKRGERLECHNLGGWEGRGKARREFELAERPQDEMRTAGMVVLKARNKPWDVFTGSAYIKGD
ncbi:hypothetical protein LshimejAT787_0800650 [Lyophyllum shimeji]|uniref:Uncharacterized protein n=1 Tax=Lyophyllum shimeji TaxID=47721 RepID=A0A9P3UM96_LYOSH|nr:hypothetical protein LshimejAT787_0800650 [Lyophyllum shimeji]